MKKFIKLSIYILICFSLIGCSTQKKESSSTKELIRYTTSDKLKNIKVIKNQKTIKEIKNIVNNVKWSDKVYNRDQYFYSFWVEKEGSKERIATYDLWSNEKDTLIFNEKTGKYGFVNPDDKIKLKEIFNWWN